jgi:hypothetical protein
MKVTKMNHPREVKVKVPEVTVKVVEVEAHGEVHVLCLYISQSFLVQLFREYLVL